MENIEAGVGSSTAAQQKFTDSEYVEVKKLLENLPSICELKDSINLEVSFERFVYISDLYQEQSHLLDPKIDEFLNILLKYVKSHWLKRPAPQIVNEAFKYMAHLTKIRGYKVISRRLPHEINDLDPALSLLEAATDEFWETRYMLLIWLTLLCKLPFPLDKFDLGKPVGFVSTKKRLLSVALPFLDHMDKSREAAALFLAEFVSRPDTNEEFLSNLVVETLDILKRANPADVQDGVRATGRCSLLAVIFKRTKREYLNPVAERVAEETLVTNLATTNNILLRKLITKLIQRVGLVFLKPQVAAWRYSRGNRTLSLNVARNLDADVSPTVTAVYVDDDASYDIPELVERIIGFLLNMLKDKDTIVRWSAAKGVARIVSRLPKSLAAEVISSILTYFSPRESDGAWHGACLALAELGCRGFLLPESLPNVVPSLLAALIYDESRGNYSIGAHVRDAACYLCWSFARAYDPKEMAPFVDQVAGALLTVALFDRQINCRRAASAAFQENVGRQGAVAHGIDILTIIDYFAVGNRTNCYKELSVQVARYAEYRNSIIDHLIEQKMPHWDKEIRRETSLALCQLCAIDPGALESKLPALVTFCTCPDLFRRHGAILAVGQIVFGLSKFGSLEHLDADLLADIQKIPVKIVELQYLKTVGGDLVRSALNSFVDNLSQALILERESIVPAYFNILYENASNLNEDIRTEAASAAKSLSGNEAAICDKEFVTAFISRCCHAILSATSEMQRIAAALTLGALSAKFIDVCSVNPTLAMDALIFGVTLREKEKNWAESRRDCLHSLTELFARIGGKLDALTFKKIVDILLKSFDDYTIDSRGDVGVFVREAAAKSALQIFFTAFDDAALSTYVDAATVHAVLCKLLQMCCEKIDRTRLLAGDVVARILHHVPQIPFIQHRKALDKIFDPTDCQLTVASQTTAGGDSQANSGDSQAMRKFDAQAMEISDDAQSTPFWADCKKSYAVFAQLLAYPEYSYHVLLGFVITAGGLGESLAKNACESLLNFVDEIHENAPQLELFVENMLTIFDDNKKVDRVTLPLMKVVDSVLLSSNYLDQFTNFDVIEKLVRLTINETGRSKNQHKINLGLSICCGVLQFDGTKAADEAMRHVIGSLTHPYPRVRRQAASQLYEGLLAYGNLDNHSEQVLSLLTDTNWDAEVNLLKETKLEIAHLLKVEI